ncbi:MAG: 4-alpha-glucanotransferase [Mucinivorans sp.]
MLLHFSIDYHTQWSQKLTMCVSSFALAEPHDVEGECTDGHTWHFQFNIEGSPTDMHYIYQLRTLDNVVLAYSWCEPNLLLIKQGCSSCSIYDSWHEHNPNKVFMSSPFKNVFFARSPEQEPKVTPRQGLTIIVSAPTVLPNQELVLVGSSEVLGKWDVKRGLKLSGRYFPYWVLQTEGQNLCMGDNFKFVVTKNGHPMQWEQGENRIWHHPCPQKDEGVVVGGLQLNVPACSWRGAGVAIPVFSLRSENSCGIGEFADLMPMADWVHRTGQRVVQILPVNDTTKNFTWRDSYPYSTISTFALHPLYLNLKKMGSLKNEKLALEIESEGKRLNSLETVDYEGVSKLKWSFFREIYAQDGVRTLRSRDFMRFYEASAEWLCPYAVFCYLRDRNGTADFNHWKNFSKYKAKTVSELCNPKAKEWKEVALHLFLQYHLDKQLREASTYARALGVVLKGDIPIGVSRDGVDAWSHPQLFNMGSQAGAPPDDFATEGQNWGFPTYNWQAMAKDGYSWWRSRFVKMADYFDIYRVDHILGFFRIWEIPLEQTSGVLGHFSPAKPLSAEELSERGLPMNEERYLHPFIHQDFLAKFFGDFTQQAIDHFLEPNGYGMYKVKDRLNTQAKVQRYFHGKSDEYSVTMCRGLMGLLCEVLFVVDPKETGAFHPRIAAQQTKSYERLEEWEKQRFDEIYNDFFYHRHNDFWAAQAIEKLPALINSTSMLCCAEDLGMVPNCVPQVMSDLQILTLEIQRMPKRSSELFSRTENFPYMSVCTTSSHDIPPLREWWEQNTTTTQQYYNQILGWYNQAPARATAEICEAIVGNHLCSPSILCILPLQDYMAIDETLRPADPTTERINNPANANHYWRYRMPLTIEQLLAAENFNTHVSDMVRGAERE